MKKFLVLLGAALLFSGMLPIPTEARNIELNIREFNCLQDGNVVIHYSVVNTLNFDHPNVSLCFIITREGKSVACRELRVVVEKGADGSQVYETVIKAPCGQGSYGLKSAVIYDAKRYQIEEWFAGCPGSWESKGNDELKKAIKISGEK